MTENKGGVPTFAGIDIGGTFTDAIFFKDNKLFIEKEPTTPDDPGRGVMKLARKLAGTDFILIHGSTLATNAVLERKGATTAFITTEGFRDILEIGRQDRKTLYVLEPFKVKPLIGRDFCFSLPERIDSKGNVLKKIDLEKLREILVSIRKKNVTSLAVCFLFSYCNDAHERIVKDEASDMFNFVSVSSAVLSEYREYERASTTVLNAYVSPILESYIKKLEKELYSIGAAEFKIMESGGGIIPASDAGSLGVRTLLSGPAGGVAGAFHIASLAGIKKIITLDMGGTSTDVSLCDGKISRTFEGEIGGLPVRTPMVDIVTIGAGGGSIARVDEAGLLKVGPDSAGMDPGPAAYGKGKEATVTDAHLVLGTFSPEDFLGGGFPVSREKAKDAVGKIAEMLKTSLEEAAGGIIKVAISHMERLLRVVTLERGNDPRLFTLVPFGGAGPVHAPYIAESLEIRRILIPRYPGVLSALGMLLCDFRLDFSKSLLLTLDEMDEKIHNDVLAGLYRQAQYYIKNRYFLNAYFDISLDLRYRGQSFELNVEYERPECIAKDSCFSPPPFPAWNRELINKRFHKAHMLRYNFTRPEEPIEIVNYRLTVVGITPKPAIQKKELGLPDCSKAKIGEREIYLLDGERVKMPVYSRERLKSGNIIKSPAIITQYDTTILVKKPWKALIDEYENIIMKKC